jgi:hypothetical protein
MARGVNEGQIALRKGGNYTLLSDFLSRRLVEPLPFVVTQVLTMAGVNVKLIPAAILAGNIAKGTTTVYSGGVVAAALAGAVGTGATTKITDTAGQVLNLVSLRDSTTKDPILVGGKVVYGLIQCASTVTDGDAIGAAESENLQISFVYIAADDTLTLTVVTATAEFNVTKMVTERNIPTISLKNGLVSPDVIAPVTTTTNVAKLKVTTAFSANSVITLSTGAGDPDGASTVTGEAVTLPASAELFNAENKLRVRLGGIQQDKGTDVIWDSTTTLHFANPLDIDDTIEVEREV